MIRSLLTGATVLAAVLLGSPVGAQDAFGVIGTWEMTGIENAPVAETVVFARMTFTGDRLVTTAVYLDEDDGELSARITDDGYVESAGQLVVRAPGSVTVLEVGRTLDGLVVRDLRTEVSLMLRAANPADALDPDLVGSWAGSGGGHTWQFRFELDGRSFVRRDADDETEEPYTVAGAYLLVDRDAYRYTFAGGRLILSREDETLDLARTAVAAEARP